MKRLLLPPLAALALPTAVNANVDPKVAEFCMKATDFKGCVDTMSEGTKKNDSIEGLKNVIKQVAARLENGVSLKSSKKAFRPLVDKLAIVKDSYSNNEFVNRALKAEFLFNVLQSYWAATIYYKECAEAQNPEIYKFNEIVGKQVISPLPSRKRFGLQLVNETDSEVARVLIYQYIIKVLKDDPSLKEIPKSTKKEAINTIERPAWMEEKLKGCAMYPTKKQRDLCIKDSSP